ncbi:keratin-associated protein 16-1-like [Cydia fagiglandana]|uniref:keratin-associated protein 16-1-like n=1 Tax=Cydia fagiglandana TaxID=1458189 RepID=UPI002FEE2982
MTASKQLLYSYSVPNVNFVYVCLVSNITPGNPGKSNVGSESRHNRPSLQVIDNPNEEVGTSKDNDVAIEVQRSVAFHELIESYGKLGNIEYFPEKIEQIASETIPLPPHEEEDGKDDNKCGNPKILSLTKTKWLSESRDGSPDARDILMQSTSESSVGELPEHDSTHKALSTVLALDKEHNLFGLSNTYIPQANSKAWKKLPKESDSKAVFHQTAIVQACYKTRCRRKSKTDLPPSLKCGCCKSKCCCAKCRSCTSCTTLICRPSCSTCAIPCTTPCSVPCGSSCVVPCPLYWVSICNVTASYVASSLVTRRNADHRAPRVPSPAPLLAQCRAGHLVWCRVRCIGAVRVILCGAVSVVLVTVAMPIIVPPVCHPLHHSLLSAVRVILCGAVSVVLFTVAMPIIVLHVCHPLYHSLLSAVRVILCGAVSVVLVTVAMPIIVPPVCHPLHHSLLSAVRVILCGAVSVVLFTVAMPIIVLHVCHPLHHSLLSAVRVILCGAVSVVLVTVAMPIIVPPVCHPLHHSLLSAVRVILCGAVSVVLFTVAMPIIVLHVCHPLYHSLLSAVRVILCGAVSVVLVTVAMPIIVPPVCHPLHHSLLSAVRVILCGAVSVVLFTVAMPIIVLHVCHPLHHSLLSAVRVILCGAVAGQTCFPKPCSSTPCPTCSGTGWCAGAPACSITTPDCSKECPRFGFQVSVIKKPKYDPVYTEIEPKSSCVLSKPLLARRCHHRPRCSPPSECFPYLMPCYWPSRCGAPCSEPSQCFHNPPCLRGRTRRGKVHPLELCPRGQTCGGKDKGKKCENYSCIGRNNEALAEALTKLL